MRDKASCHRLHIGRRPARRPASLAGIAGRRQFHALAPGILEGRRYKNEQPSIGADWRISDILQQT